MSFQITAPCRIEVACSPDSSTRLVAAASISALVQSAPMRTPIPPCIKVWTSSPGGIMASSCSGVICTRAAEPVDGGEPSIRESGCCGVFISCKPFLVVEGRSSVPHLCVRLAPVDPHDLAVFAVVVRAPVGAALRIARRAWSHLAGMIPQRVFLVSVEAAIAATRRALFPLAFAVAHAARHRSVGAVISRTRRWRGTFNSRVSCFRGVHSFKPFSVVGGRSSVPHLG